MNAAHPHSSPLLNLNDPIQIHLLVETALWDSKEYEILSQEEVDELKKQCQSLSQRIEQTRQTLAIQSKMRDAAIAMAKLNKPTDKKKSVDSQESQKKTLGFLRSRSNSGQFREADIERATVERRCEDLAAELWSLEKRRIEPQQRLLKHTAGILQMTHKGPKRNTSKGRPQQGGNMLPGSPESMYTYHNARNSIEPINEEDFFDERSLYRPADLDNDFVGTLDFTQDLMMPSSEQSKEQMQRIAYTEQKLEDLNSALREVIIKANPKREASYNPVPLAKTNSQGKPTDPGETLQSHLDYLEQGIATLDREHTASTRATEELNASLEDTMEELNREVRGLLLPNHPNLEEPPELTGQGLREQLYFFQDIMGTLEEELLMAADLSRNTGSQEKHEQMQAVLEDLWEIILAGEEDLRQKSLQRRAEKSLNGIPESDESDGHDSDPNEPFTIQAFSKKVQWLWSQATRLKDQKKVLQRQIKQQRELNNKSDATKDAEIVKKTQDLERTKNLLTKAEINVDAVQEQLSLVMSELNKARQQQNHDAQLARKNSESAALKAAQDALTQANGTIAELEAQLEDLQDDQKIGNAEIQSKLAESESKITALKMELAAAAIAKENAEALVAENHKEIDDKEKEIEGMNMDLARLQTEVTIARAELDGAYGSRAQRAAEVAANPAIQREIDELNKKNTSLVAEIATLRMVSSSAGQGSIDQESKMQELKKELEETIEEYELMTKASIEWEKERENLEQTIDKLRDEKENLEAQLSDERVRWLGMRSPGGPEAGPAPAGNTSTTVLKNEFKKMMRDTRAENTKVLRVCFIPPARPPFPLSSSRESWTLISR